MDGFTNSKIEKQTIYEIYRACRLCGAGAGYKMPIIQNVVNLDNGEVELKQKIRECVQIEVHQDDKMPPLICELCVDKVNDFFEFLEMCRQTNKQTRLRLGLPSQTLPRGAPDAGDCILGVTEPIFIDNYDEPTNRSRGKTVKLKKERDNRDSKNKVPLKKELRKEEIKEKPEARALRRKAPSPSPSPPSTPRLLRGNRLHDDNVSLSRLQDGTPESRSLRKRAPSRSPSPARVQRGNKRQHDDEVSLSRLQKPRKPDESTPKSILKRDRESKSEDSTKLKRLREKENEKLVNSCKKVKIVVQDIKSPKEPSLKHQCNVCEASFDKPQGLSNHMRSHPKDRPKVECKDCKKTFIHKNLLDIHRCSGRTTSKPTKQEPQVEKTEKPKPMKQERQIEKPEKKPPPKPTRVATPKRKPTSSKPFVIDPAHKKLLKPLEVRIAKCDPLLENKIGDHYDVTDVDYDYGTDKTCVYPYIYTFRHLRIKSEPSYMVNIQDEIKNAFDRDESYVHWDSDETDSDLELSDTKKVNSLTALSLKTLFSPKVIGKVPKKRRKTKVESAFDSILNSTNDFDSDMRLGIDNIINSLGDDKDGPKIDKDDNDSLFGDAPNSPAITNSDFDSLFGCNVNDSDVPKSINASKGSIGNIISDSKSEDSNTTNFSIDFDDKVASDDKNKEKDNAEKDNNVSLESKDSESSKDDKQAENSVVISDIDKSECTDKSNTEDNEIATNDVKDKETQDGDANLKEDIEKEKRHDADTNNENLIQDENVKDNHIESKDIQKDKKDAANDENHVNGQAELAQEFNMDDLEDVSDTEMEDSKLMEALDRQIDANGAEDAKTCASERDSTTAVTGDLQVPASVKSSDLESISDGEFP